MDWGLAKVLDQGGVADEERALRAERRRLVRPDVALRVGGAGIAGRLGARHAVVHGTRAGPGRAGHARRAGGRLRAGLDPLRDPHRPARVRGRDRGRGLPQGEAGRPVGRVGTARRVRRRRGAGGAGAVVPGRRAEAPAAGRGRGGRPADGVSRRRREAAEGGRAGPGPGRGPGRRGAQASPADAGPGRRRCSPPR